MDLEMSLCFTNECFLTQSLFPVTSGNIVRVDGRQPTDFRKLDIRLGPGIGQAECSIGQTRTRAVVTGELIKPPSHRPREGRLSINVEAGPMAAPATLPSGDSSGLVGSSQTPEGVSLCNQLERMLKGSSAVDVEALCVSSGLLVWNLRLDVHILADCGNVGDAAAIASIVALRHYRKADVDIEDGEVIYRPQSDPVPISVHHMPIPVTFAIIPSDSDMPPVLLADPTSLEEGLHGNRGQLVLAMNQYGQLCSLLKSGGAPLLLDRDILPAVRLATLRAKTIIDLINKKLSDDEYKRVEVHKADIHHKYTTTGLSLGPFFQNNASAHHRKRSIAHFEMLKPMDGVEEQTGINIEEDPQYDQSYSQKPILAPRTYSISNKPQDSPELIRVVPPAPVVGQPEVAKSDDDDLDDLSAAVLVKPKKKRRPRK